MFIPTSVEDDPIDVTQKKFAFNQTSKKLLFHKKDKQKTTEIPFRCAQDDAENETRANLSKKFKYNPV